VRVADLPFTKFQTDFSLLCASVALTSTTLCVNWNFTGCFQEVNVMFFKVVSASQTARVDLSNYLLLFLLENVKAVVELN